MEILIGALTGLTLAVLIALWSISIDGKPLWKLLLDRDTSWVRKF